MSVNLRHYIDFLEGNHRWTPQLFIKSHPNRPSGNIISSHSYRLSLYLARLSPINKVANSTGNVYRHQQQQPPQFQNQHIIYISPLTPFPRKASHHPRKPTKPEPTWPEENPAESSPKTRGVGKREFAMP